MHESKVAACIGSAVGARVGSRVVGDSVVGVGDSVDAVGPAVGCAEGASVEAVGLVVGEAVAGARRHISQPFLLTLPSDAQEMVDSGPTATEVGPPVPP
jgi:hypothetical protein